MNSVINIHSSPPSGGTATHNGTPSTVPTMMSPEGPNCSGRSDARVPPFNLASNFGASTVSRPPFTGRPPFSAGTFSIDTNTTRAFRVSGLHPGTPGLYETVAHCYRHFKSLQGIDASVLTNNGSFIVAFYDCRDALAAFHFTAQNPLYGPNVQISFLTQKELAASQGVNYDKVSDHAAEYLLSVVNVGTPVWSFTHQAILRICEGLVGDVEAIEDVRPLQYAVKTYRVEWSNMCSLAMKLSGQPFMGYHLTIAPFTPDVDVSFGPPHHMSHFPEETRVRKDLAGNSGSGGLRPPPPNGPSASHNVIDIERIQAGQDVRTTIMLRNIPNRVDQATLKRLLDETSHGQYDFMYLRIDFANNCNVGYAFINFVDPLAIIAFALARAGHKWNLFQSDKVAEISYATIQGCDQLVQKFRNSSVMLEQPAFRPKLYKTGDGPDAGTELPFPQADNHAKLKRSCDNAEHVGLYHPPASSALIPARSVDHRTVAPRNQSLGGVWTLPAPTRRATTLNYEPAQLEAPHYSQCLAASITSSQIIPPTSLYAPREGQAYRERQRRQGSQFDRGTPGAETELAGFNERFNYAFTPSRASTVTPSAVTPVRPFQTSQKSDSYVAYGLSRLLGRSFSGGQAI